MHDCKNHVGLLLIVFLQLWMIYTLCTTARTTLFSCGFQWHTHTCRPARIILGYHCFLVALNDTYARLQESFWVTIVFLRIDNWFWTPSQPRRSYQGEISCGFEWNTHSRLQEPLRSTIVFFRRGITHTCTTARTIMSYHSFIVALNDHNTGAWHRFDFFAFSGTLPILIMKTLNNNKTH